MSDVTAVAVVVGLVIVVGSVAWIQRKATAVERGKRKHVESDLQDREKFDETYRKARGGAYNRALEWLRRHPPE